MENSNSPIHPTGQSQTGIGLTKREYFAGLAMQGILSASDILIKDGIYTVNGRNIDVLMISGDAVAISDALLRELEK